MASLEELRTTSQVGPCVGASGLVVERRHRFMHSTVAHRCYSSASSADAGCMKRESNFPTRGYLQTSGCDAPRLRDSWRQRVPKPASD